MVPETWLRARMDAEIQPVPPEVPEAAPGEAMRRNFYVKPFGTDAWEAISAIAAERFDSEAEALRWARATARKQWETTGLPWGVRVKGPNGGWVYDTCLGRAADDGVVSGGNTG
jgi:hypothetical protein